MRRRVIAILAAGCLAAAAASPARAQDSSHQAEYLKIYLKINDADQLERKGDYRGALADFKDCYARLQRIHNSDPSWESALVLSRMADCKTKIIDLSDLAAQQPATPAPETTPTPGTEEITPPAVDTGEVANLKQQLSDVQQKLDDALAKLTNTQLEAKNLHTQLDAVNEELAALKSGQSEDAKMGDLLSENKALTDKLTAAQKEIATIKPQNPKSALALARTELKNTQDKLEASEAANTALQQTTSTLQTQLDQAQSDLRAANQRLAAAPPTSPEYETLKRENEVMRDILQRELQEQAHRDMAKRLMQEEFDRLKITSAVLREQLDILGSPMTPATTDEERALLDGLRTPPAQITTVPSEGNGFAASQTPAPPGTNTTATPAPPETNMATATTNAPGEPTAPPATNSAPATTVVSETNAPAVTTNAAPEQMASSTNTPAATDTNQPMVTVVTPATTDNNPPASTNTTAASVPETPTVPASTNTAPSATNMAATPTPGETPSTNAAPSAPVVTAAETNGAAATAPNMASDTNTPPSTPTPPPPTGTTTYQETVIKNNDNTTGDANEYSSKPRLPEDMRDTAQQAADLFKMQRYDEAADKYQTIIDKYPDSLYAWSNLGVVRFQQGKLPEALKALQRAVSLSPTDAFSYSNLGIVYYQMGQYKDAISALERALALDPTNAMSHNYLGCACSQQGWQEVAEKEFTKAIELNDNFGDAHFNLALIYATEKPQPALEMARRHYKRALELGVQPDPRLEKLLQLPGTSQVSEAGSPK